MTEDDGEDEGGLATAGSLVDISAIGQQRADSTFVASGYGLGQWNRRTQLTIPENTLTRGLVRHSKGDCVKRENLSPAKAQRRKALPRC